MKKNAPQTTTPLTSRLTTKLKFTTQLLVGSTGALAVAFAITGGFGFFAYQYEIRQERAAMQFLSQFSPQRINPSAQALDSALIDLHLEPVFTKVKITPIDKTGAFYQTLFQYTDQQLTKVQGPLDPIPANLQAYLQQYAPQLKATELLLTTQAMPKWGVDFDKLADLEQEPLVFLGLVNLHRLLLLRSLNASQSGDFDQAQLSLTAAWKLNQAVLMRPESVGQLAGTLQLSHQLAFLRHLPQVASASPQTSPQTTLPPWSDQLAQIEPQRLMVRAFQFEGWLAYRDTKKQFFQATNPNWTAANAQPEGSITVVESYVRLSASNVSDNLDAFYTTLAQQNPCTTDLSQLQPTLPWWNRASLLGVPRAKMQWQRAGMTMLALELTQHVLQAKQLAAQSGQWPTQLPNLESQVCPGTQWQYQVTPAGEMQLALPNIPAANTPGLIAESDFSALSYRATDW
jgi:hypothetical protein